MSVLFYSASALTLVLPTPIPVPAIVQPAPVRSVVQYADDTLLFPTTNVLAKLDVQSAGGFMDGPKRDIYKGGLDLDSLLDSVDVPKAKEDPALARMREREAAEAEAAKEKFSTVVAAESMGKDLSFAGATKEKLQEAAMAAAAAKEAALAAAASAQ